ncbi:hypothetical protein MKC91_03130 [[Clostridium] innocuum]|nr:hypothetical protein [[Clostridium] innocuum]MCR0533317.1 hypothetical protein [[Clostridium] innocuum]MCR0537383.1 hypothetical protein [[Clostridium] innocuum]MDU1119191.1 hypothetical protein [Erysipelotrichaceae bacterium]
MKNKTKIVIGAGILSMSLCTVIGTGVVNFGQLLAENNTQVAVASPQSFNVGDKIIIGGLEFIMINPQQSRLLSKSNFGYAVAYENIPSFEEFGVTHTADWTGLVKDSRLPEYDELFKNNQPVTHDLGNGYNFWTSTAGKYSGTRKVINGSGDDLFKTPYGFGEWDFYLGSAPRCVVTSTESIDLPDGSVDSFIIDERGAETYASIDNDRQDKGLAYYDATAVGGKVGQVTFDLSTIRITDPADIRKFGLTSSITPIEVLTSLPSFSKTDRHSHIAGEPVRNCPEAHSDSGLSESWFDERVVWTGEDYVRNGGDDISIHQGSDCNQKLEDVTPRDAFVRPMITADLSSVLFTSGSDGTPMSADPQNTPVTVTLYDPDIRFSMDLNHYYDDINAGTGDVIEREYGYAEPGANRYIKLIVRDEEGQPIRYETMEDISISSNRKFSIDTGKSGLNLPVGTYTLQVFVEEDNSAVAGKSNHASEIYETKLNLQQSLTAADVSESGDKASTGSDYYNENGVIFTIKNTDENGNIGNTYPYIRVGTKDELNNNTIGFTTASSTYKKDGIYERKQDDDSNALFVELCTNSDGSGQKTTMLPIESVKIDAKDPYFSSGKNGEGKPLTLEDGEGEHKKVIPHANDYTSDMYNGDTLKPDAVPIENGIKSYKLTATPLTTDGKVDDSKEVITQTIQTADEKFKDCEPYFELQGKEAFWVKVTAVDQAGRETTIEQKLYMDSTQPAAPTVSAVLKDGSDTAYAGGDIKNEDGQIVPNWSGSDIKITLSLSADELKELKYGIDHYEYTTTAEIKAWTDAGNKAEDLVWKSLGKKDGSDEALNVFETDGSKVSEDAEYHFRAVSKADVKGKEKVFKVRKDKAIPKLSLKIIDVATQQEYVEGAAAKKGLRFTITPDGEMPVSGVKYYCRGVPSGWKPKARADGDLPSDEEIPWNEIQKKNGSYSILIADDFEGTYYFRAVSGANVATASVDVKKTSVDIGVEQPSVPISYTATVDKDGSAYDGEWTSDDLTITLSGGLNDGDTVKYYEYADSPTSTNWTQIDATDGVFALNIRESQNMNRDLYFRVVKDGDVDDIPYSTTKKGLRIRHDAKAPIIRKVTLDPQSPQITTAFVTLRVECAGESEASGITAYSIDDGATWIEASSKDPKVFTYTFEKNTENINIKVKDAVGNIAAYGETLRIDNIDKTGPSAPKFTNSDEFKNGVWKNAAQDVKVAFTPADTGAEEWIQYRIQKLVGEDYQEYDPVQDTTGSEISWKDSLIGQAEETIRLDKEGTYRVIVRTKDSMDRVSAESMTTSTVRIDMTAPTITEITEKKDKWESAAESFLNMLTGGAYFKDHITYTFDGADNAGGSGLEKYQYQLAAADALQPDETQWVDAYKGEVNIEEDFNGKLFARSVDYAGNASNTVQFDGIQVDATLPSLTITPKDLSVSWTDINSIAVTAVDSGSGIKEGKVTYTTTYAGTEDFTGGTLTLDDEGNAALRDLPDGDYTIEFTAEDNSDHVESVIYPVRIDTGAPKIAILDKSADGAVREKELVIEVQNAISGQKQLNVTLDGKGISGLTESNRAPEVLTGADVQVYTIRVPKNGKFAVEAIANAEHDGENVRTVEELTITNVYDVAPKLKVEAFTGKDETQDRYTSGEWTSEHVEIVLSNTEGAIKPADLTFQYQEYDADGVQLTSDWTNIEDTGTSTKTGRFSVYGNGQREYRFRAVMLDPDNPTAAPILISNEESIVIAQDTQRPIAPILVRGEVDDYTQTKWYGRSQTLEVEFIADTSGLGQWIEYIDATDTNPKWRKAELNAATKNYEIKISGDKQHVIRIRSNDAYDRSSVETIAYVNIDMATPVFDMDIKYTSSNANLTLVTTDENDASTIGISGLYDATIQKKENGVVVPDTLQHFYGGKAVIGKDSGNGIYEVTLTTNSGKTVTKDIEINGISLPKPVIGVSGTAIAADATEAAYTSGTWTDVQSVRLDITVKNPDVSGAVTYEYQEDGDSTWTATADEGRTASLNVSGRGRHTINVRARNASDAVSETYSFRVWIDDVWDDHINIQNQDAYAVVDTPWYNKTQTIKATFTRDLSGCNEWVEYSEDGTTWTHNSRNTYEVSETGRHELYVRKNDEIGSGNDDTGTRINVYIDKETIRDFRVKIDKNSYSSFLSTITFGIYHNEAKEAVISGNYGISGEDKVYIQIVSDPKDYVNVYAQNAGEAGWQEYTGPLSLENDFKGFIYAKAKDKAGNTSNIIRTDGIVIDTVAPQISIDHHGGDWSTQEYVDVDVSDFSDVEHAIVGNASGIRKISYETYETSPVEGEVEINDNRARISNLHDGEYELHVTGSDKAGNQSEATETIRIDRKQPTLKISGYKELSFTAANDLVLEPLVGASGIKQLSVRAALQDGGKIEETSITGPDYRYKVLKNGTYTFTLTNNAGVRVEEVLEVTNIAEDMDDIMGLDIRTLDLDNKEIDYRNAEELPDTLAEPSWTAHDVIFKARGTTAFKASVDGGIYTDFENDGTFTISSEGIHIVTIKNDSTTDTRTFIVKIDKYEVKDVTIKDSNRYAQDTWFNDKRVIQATYTPDDTTGIDEWLEYYDANQSAWVKGDSVILDHEGTHTVKFRGNDELNRPTAEQSVTVNIDKTAPSDLQIRIEKSTAKEFINHLFPNMFDETVEVNIRANGDISGNRKIEYQLIDEGAGESYNEMIGWQTYTGSFTIEDGFKGKVYARATDNAGNRTLTAVTEEGIVVDTAAPQIVFQTAAMSTWQKENTVKATITPTLSGLHEVWYTTTRYGIVTKHTIDLKDIDKDNNVTLRDLPNGRYVIDLYARNKAGKSGTAKLDSVMFENRGPQLKVDAELDKKVTSIPVKVDVDMSGLYTELTSLTWESGSTTPQDILTDKSFTINSNGVYKITAVTSSGVTSEKILTVTNISSVSTTLGISAYKTKEPDAAYTGGTTWSDQDITLEVRETSGKIAEDELTMEMRVIDQKMGSVTTPWTIIEADREDSGLYKTVAADEGSMVYEFRSTYQDVVGPSILFQVNIDRSAPKRPLFSEATVTKYDNASWHNAYEAFLEAAIDASEGCDEWLEYNIDGATDFDGELLWTATKNPKSDKIKIVDDNDHIVQIRTRDRLDRVSESSELHVKLDSTRPTDFYIKAGDNKYQDFLDILTGGIFYKDSQTIEIGGNFNISGVETIEYQLVKPGDTFSADDSWTKVKVADGEDHGDFQLLPGTKGVIYARGVDKAGNETGIIRSDLITIDNSAPILKVPNDATAWSDVNTMKIQVKDMESGIAKVEYSSEDPAQSGEVELTDNVDADGYREGIIRNLKDGQYLVKIVVTDMSGRTQTKYPKVMIDTVTPDLKVEGATTKPQASTTRDLIPVVGGSGLKEIQLLEKKAEDTYEVIDTIPAVEGKEKYPYEFIENGTYYFRVVNNAEQMSEVREVEIGNIKSEAPVIVHRADNGYDPSVWSGSAVVLETSTNTNAKLSYRRKGDSTYIDADHVYYQNLKFDTTGTHTYEFKAVYEGKDGAEDIVTYSEYTVKVDLQAPKKPEIANREDYENWFKQSRTVTMLRDTSDYTDGTKYGDGSKETVYYNIDHKLDAQGRLEWTKTDSDTITVDTVGDHTVIFKISDEVKGHDTQSDPVHVKIYADDPTITLIDIRKPVKTFDLGIEIGGSIDADDQVKSITVERIGSDTIDVQSEQDERSYSFPVSKNGTYIVRVEMEKGGSAEASIEITNIIEEDPILEVKAVYDDSGVEKEYTFGTWNTTDVKLRATDPKSTADLTMEVRQKKDGVWGDWAPYTAGADIVTDATGTYIYQFKTILSKGSDTYETIMDETYAIKVDQEAPSAVIINEYADYSESGKWVSDPVNITTTFTADTNGAKEWVEYSLDDGTTWHRKNSVLISKAGENKIIFRTADELGRTTSSPEDTVYVNIDKSEAGTLMMKVGSDAAISSSPNNITFDQYYGAGDLITLTLMKTEASEDTDGRIYYQFADERNGYDPDSWQEYTAPVSIPENFRGSMYAYGENKFGKKTAIIRSNGITLDKDAPVIVKPDSDMSEWSKSNSYLVEFRDDLSGIDEETATYARYVDADTSTPLEAAQKIKVTDGKGTLRLPDGEYYVEISVRDKAGNAAAAVRHKVMINADQCAFTLNSTVSGDHAAIDVNVTEPPLSGIRGIYIRSQKSGWELLGTSASVSYDAYRNGEYEVKVVNGAGRDSAIQTIEITGIDDTLPSFDLETTDGFTFGDFWYQPLTIRVLSDAEEIYYSTSGKDGPWQKYEDKIYINETSAYRFTFKVKSKDKEYISLPYDTRVIMKQADGPATVVSEEERSPMAFMRQVFSSYAAEEKAAKWYNLGTRITFPASGDTAPGYKTGTFTQILQADASGNGIGYNERNFTLVDEADPTYIFNNEGRYVVYKFYAYYIEGEEDNWSTPADIEKTYYNIDGSAPEELKLSAEVDGSTTILNDPTGGLFFKEPITIIPQGEDSLSGIDHYEFQRVSCNGDACDAVTSKESDWSTADSLSVPQDFEGIVFVRAVDGSKPVGNTLEKSVRLTIRDDITTYKIQEDIHDWTNIKDLNIQVTPSTNGLQELRYTAYAAEGQEGEPVVLEASDPENLLYTIRDIPEGTYRLKVIPIENGGTAIHRDAHVLRIDRTKPVVQVTMEQSSQDGAAKLMNRLTLNSFYRPGLMIRATASDQAGEQDIDPQLLKIEYSSNGTDWKEYTTPLTFNDEEIVNVAFRAIDPAGNVSEVVTKDGIAVDATAPGFEGASNNATYWLPRTVTVKDSLSGVDTVKLNDTATGSSVLVKDYGTSRIEARDRSGNESAIAFTIKGLDGIKDEEITDDLIQSVEKEFEEQKPGYDKELADKIRQQIDDLKNRKQSREPGDDGQSKDPDDTKKPDASGNENPGGSVRPDGTKPDGNGSDGSGNGIAGVNGVQSSNKVATLSGNRTVKTGDTSNVPELMLMGTLSAMLGFTLVLKKKASRR